MYFKSVKANKKIKGLVLLADMVYKRSIKNNLPVFLGLIKKQREVQGWR